MTQMGVLSFCDCVQCRYAQEIPSGVHLSQQESFHHFCTSCTRDSDKQLDTLVWNTFSGPIRVLLDNRYVFESFWDFHRGELDEAQWQERFARGAPTACSNLATRLSCWR